jgi:hypothetical protein
MNETTNDNAYNNTAMQTTSNNADNNDVPQTLLPQCRQWTTDYNADDAAVKQTKQTMDNNMHDNAAMQTKGDKADNNNAAADFDAAMQRTDNNADDDAMTQTTGDNETTMTTQPQTSMPQRKQQGDVTTSQEKGTGGHGAIRWRWRWW